MPNYEKATNFQVFAVDHGRVLLDANAEDTATLLSGTDAPMQVEFTFEVNGETQTHKLSRHDGAFAHDAKVVLSGGEVKVDVPKTFSYKSEDENVLLKVTGENKFEGLIYNEETSSLSHFMGENGELKIDGQAKKHLDNPNLESRNLRELQSENPGPLTYWDNCHSNQPSVSLAHIGVAVGYIMAENFPNTYLNMIESYIEESNFIYKRQMDVQLVIDTVVVGDDTRVYPWASTTCQDIQRFHLYEMRDWRSTERTRLTAWHLFEDCFGQSGSTLGIAYVGVLCDASLNVGVTYLSLGGSLERDYPTWGTAAHELGHNFNGAHSFEEGQGRTGGIMDYGPEDDKLIDGVMQFNTEYRKTEVCREVNIAANQNNDWCLEETNLAQPSSDPTTTSQPWWCNIFLDACKPEVAAVQKNLECVKHRNRAVHSTLMQPLRTVIEGIEAGTCKQACEVEEGCKAYTVGWEGYCELSGEVKYANELGFQYGYDTYVCGEDELPNGILAEKSMDDLLEDANLSDLSNSCCSIADTEFMGINSGTIKVDSQEACFTSCLLSSNCKSASYQEEFGNCLFYGGEEFTNSQHSSKVFTSMSCDRQCINQEVETANGGAAGFAGGAFVGVAVALVGLAAVMGVLYKKRQQAVKEDEAVVQKMTL